MQGRIKLHPFGQAVAALTLALTATGVSQAASGVLPVHSDRPTIVDNGSAVVVAPLNSNTRIGVTITLPLSNKADLDSFAAAVSNPSSPLYGHYLTPAEFTAKYGASQSSYNTVMDWIARNRLQVTGSSLTRGSISISATAGQLAHAMSVKFNNYTSKVNPSFFSATSNPKLPADVASCVNCIYGMSSFVQGTPQHVVVTPAMRAQMAAARAARVALSGFSDKLAATHSGSSFGDGLIGAPTNDTGGTGHDGNFSPSDLNSAYLIPPFDNNGAGQTLGIYAAGGYVQGDEKPYEKYYHLPNTPVFPRPVAGYDESPTGGVDLEADLDMDMELALSPSAKGIYVYEAGNEVDFASSLIDALNAVADDHIVNALDISYGTDELVQFLSDGSTVFDDENTAFERCTAEGISVFVSAGDQGAYGRLVLEGLIAPSQNAEDPAAQPFVTSVGGTTMFLFNQQDFLETVWNELGANGSATGGGVSQVWSIPSYQLLSDGTSVAVANGGSPSMRNVPDVAADADPYTPVDVFTSDTTEVPAPGFYGIGGTSASAPIWTGFSGVINQNRAEAGEPPLGFANPLLYHLGEDSSLLFQFHDVYDGSNGNPNLFNGVGGYFAGVGYDNTTGFGSIYGSILLSNLVAVPTAYASNTGLLPAAPTDFHVTSVTPTTFSFAWNRAQYATAYVVEFQISDGVDANDNPLFYYEFAKASQATHDIVRQLAPGGTYTFRLIATNPSGTTADSNLITLTTPTQ